MESRLRIGSEVFHFVLKAGFSECVILREGVCGVCGISGYGLGLILLKSLFQRVLNFSNKKRHKKIFFIHVVPGAEKTFSLEQAQSSLV